jgi:thymidylate kinase
MELPRFNFLLLSLILLFSSAFCDEKGKLIAFAGISGSGKSSAARELANLCEGVSFHEPEENEWPEFIRHSQDYGELSALMVFRAMRVDALYKAKAWKAQGGLAFVDSYYDKLTAFYLGKPGMEWLMAPDDPYFSAVLEIMTKDVDLLPDADCIVLLDISKEDWIKMLTARNRERDNIEGFVANYNLYKAYTYEAVSLLSARRNIPIVIFNQSYSTPRIQAEKLKNVLIQKGILEKDRC